MKKNILTYCDLITSLKTMEEIDDLSSELDMLTSLLFKSPKMSLKKALSSISVNSARKIVEIFTKNNLDMTDKELICDFLNTLKDLIKKFKVIKLTLAFAPTKKTIDNIHEYISEYIGTGYILDIEIDASILGGAIVIFNGKYKDFTLRKSLEETFKNKRGDLFSFAKSDLGASI